MNKLHFGEKYLILGIVIMAIIVTSGYSFAYFTVKTTVNGTTKASTTGNTATLPKVVFDGGQEVTSTTPLLPGNKITKTFNVTFTPGSDIKSVNYNVILNITENTFVTCSEQTKIINDVPNECTVGATELVYRLKRKIGTSGVDTEVVHETDLTAGVKTTQTYAETVTSSSEVTYYYTLEIEFKDTKANQLHNMGKTFSGTVDVQFATS